MPFGQPVAQGGVQGVGGVHQAIGDADERGAAQRRIVTQRGLNRAKGRDGLPRPQRSERDGEAVHRDAERRTERVEVPCEVVGPALAVHGSLPGQGERVDCKFCVGQPSDRCNQRLRELWRQGNTCRLVGDPGRGRLGVATGSPGDSLHGTQGDRIHAAGIRQRAQQSGHVVPMGVGAWRLAEELCAPSAGNPLPRSAVPCRASTTLPAATAPQGQDIGFGIGRGTMPDFGAEVT